MSLWDQLAKFAPFCPGNMQPVFICRGVRDSGHSKVLNGKHLRLAIKKDNSRIIYGVLFNQADLLKKVQTSRSFDICFILQKNGKSRRAQIQLVIQDIRFPDAALPQYNH